jgi:hypothetical protein
MSLRPFAGLVWRPGRGIRPLSGSRVAHGTPRRLQQTRIAFCKAQGARWKGVFGRVLKVSVVFLCPQFPSAPWRSVIFPFGQRRTAAQ